MANWLIDMWNNIASGEVYKLWKNGGLAAGLLWESGLFDDAPLTEFLKVNLK